MEKSTIGTIGTLVNKWAILLSLCHLVYHSTLSWCSGFFIKAPSTICARWYCVWHPKFGIRKLGTICSSGPKIVPIGIYKSACKLSKFSPMQEGSHVVVEETF